MELEVRIMVYLGGRREGEPLTVGRTEADSVVLPVLYFFLIEV